MQKLAAYINGLPFEQRKAFAGRCETSIGYLRKAVSLRQRLGIELCARIEVASGGEVTGAYLRPDADWEAIRAAAAIEK